jgi:zinc protease
MIRLPRAGVLLAALLALVAAPLPAAVAQPRPEAAAAPSRPAGAWPQARSDVRADPDILFGALPNGMRYAIRKQALPANQTALRLWFDAGSLMETDAQQGLAHFVEHMAFNGSKAVPEGDMIRILERLGLAFGPDTNASTGFEETIYQLDLPRTDAETLDTSLMLLRETAGNLTIEAGAVDRERGVVLSEERARDTPAYRIYRERLEFLLPGQRLPTRLPIGKVEVLQTAPASELRDFYRRYYRPERAVLVAVGDFEPVAVEAKIRSRFGDWSAEGPAGGDPDLGAVRPRGAEAKLVVEPGAALSLQIAWTGPADLAPDTVTERRRSLVEQLGFAVLNRRLSAVARAPNPPFLAAGGFRSNQGRSAEITMMSASAEPDGWKAALEAVEQEQRRAAEHGVRQDELDREIEELRARLRAAAAGAATRRQAELANEIVASLSERIVVTSPADDLAFFETAVKALSAAEVSAALKAAFAGQGPLLFVASPRPIEGGEAALLAALAASQKVAVTPPAAPDQLAWPYESFGPPGRVAETRVVDDMGATFVRFDNGVRLTVKPTRFRDDEVLVRVNVGDGLLALPGDRQSATWASSAFIEGGLEKISSQDMERVLASKVYGARFGVGDDAFVLSGRTRPADLEVQLQVLAAYLAEPGWRPEAFQRLLGAGRTIHDQYESTVSGVLGRDLSGLLRRGDRRWTFPSREEIAGAKLEDLRAQMRPAWPRARSRW